MISNTVEPLVSVVIPCYRQAHFLGEAIESALGQSYSRVEVIVVDDGSPDETADVAASYPGVHLVRQENGGLAAARNAGLEAGSGEFVVFLDADDRLCPDAVEIGVRALAGRPGCAAAFGRLREMDVRGDPIPRQDVPRPDENQYATLLSLDAGVAATSSVIFRRTAVEAMGGFCGAPEIRGVEDYDLYIRVARDFPVHFHDHVVTNYRRHDASMSRNAQMMLASAIAVLRRHRPRLLGGLEAERAYHAGLRKWRQSYGRHLAVEVMRSVRDRRWRDAARALWTFLRLHPGGLASYVARRLWRNARRRRGHRRPSGPFAAGGGLRGA